MTKGKVPRHCIPIHISSQHTKKKVYERALDQHATVHLDTPLVQVPVHGSAGRAAAHLGGQAQTDRAAVSTKKAGGQNGQNTNQKNTLGGRGLRHD